MGNFVVRLLILLAATMLLSACQIQGCIEADDFGYPKFTVTSRGYQIYGQNDNQTTSWYDSGYQTVAGSNLVIEISTLPSSAWTSWFGSSTDTDNIPVILSNAGAINCVPVNNNWCPAPEPTSPITPQVLNFQSAAGGAMPLNPAAGCIFRGGEGLYGLVSTVNPNTTEDDIRYLPQGVDLSYTFHLGEPYINIGSNSVFLSRYYNSSGNVYNNAYANQSTSSFNIQGGANAANYQYAGGYDALPPNNTAGELYFKILDRYYFDNGGSYGVWLKSGITSDQTTPFSTFIQYVQDKFSAAQASIVAGFVSEDSYVPMVRIILTLYIIFMGVSFVMGLTQFTQKELVIHVFKIAVVIQCTMPSSWNFFNTYFFPIFTNGPAELICIYASALSSAGSTCTPTSSLGMFDTIFHDLLSQETTIKIRSLFFHQDGTYQGEGFFIVVFIYIGIALLMVASYRAIILYFLAYIAISLLVVLTPIFMVFLLFKITKPLFDNWIKQFMIYTIQPVIVVTAVSFGSSVLMQEFHKMLGFRVCALPLFTNGPSFMSTWLAWKPDHVNFTGTQTILVPDYWTPDPVGDPGHICPPYDPSCMDNRYLDLPYLRPYPIDATYTADDRARIMRIQGGSQMVTFYDGFYFLALSFLLYKLCGVAADIGKAIAGGGAANLGQAAKQSAKGLRDTIGMAADKGIGLASGGKIMPGQTIGKVKEGFGRIQNSIASYVGGKITKGGKKAGRLIPGISQMIALDDMRVAGRKARLNKIDNEGLSIGKFKLPSGAKLDSIKEVGKMAKEQTFSNLSGGIFGTDYNRSENKYNVLTRGDHVAARFNKAFGVVPPSATPGQKEQIANYTSAQLKGLSGNLAGASRFLKMGAALSLINPAIGAGVAGFGVYKGVAGVWGSAKNLYDLANGKVNAAQLGVVSTGAPGAPAVPGAPGVPGVPGNPGAAGAAGGTRRPGSGPGGGGGSDGGGGDGGPKSARSGTITTGNQHGTAATSLDPVSTNSSLTTHEAKAQHEQDIALRASGERAREMRKETRQKPDRTNMRESAQKLEAHFENKSQKRAEKMEDEAEFDKLANRLKPESIRDSKQNAWDEKSVKERVEELEQRKIDRDEEKRQNEWDKKSMQEKAQELKTMKEEAGAREEERQRKADADRIKAEQEANKPKQKTAYERLEERIDKNKAMLKNTEKLTEQIEKFKARQPSKNNKLGDGDNDS